MQTRLYIATLVAAALAFAPVADAYELDVADKRVPLPTHDWRFLQQQCDGYDEATFGQVGCAIEAQETCHVEVGTVVCSRRDAEVQLPRGMGAIGYWHETGHLFDFTVLTDAQRAEFKRIARIPADTPWWDDDTLEGHDFDHYHPPGELFADAYSLCALRATGRPTAGVTEWWLERGVKRPVYVEGYAYPYHARWKRHMRVCQLIWNAAGRHYNRRTGG